MVELGDKIDAAFHLRALRFTSVYAVFSAAVISKGLSELIFNFFEEKYNINPIESEVIKLWKLLSLKYKQDIDYEIFINVISNVYNFVKEKNDLESFEKDLNPKNRSLLRK